MHACKHFKFFKLSPLYRFKQYHLNRGLKAQYKGNILTAEKRDYFKERLRNHLVLQVSRTSTQSIHFSLAKKSYIIIKKKIIF